MGILLSCGILCTFPSDYFYPEYYRIDAVTSSSYNIKVNGGIAYDTYAVFETYHFDSFDSHFLAYGFQKDMYTDTFFVVDFPFTNTCTLTNLIPDVQYYYIYRGELIKNPIEENHTVEGNFRTVP